VGTKYGRSPANGIKKFSQIARNTRFQIDDLLRDLQDGVWEATDQSALIVVVKVQTKEDAVGMRWHDKLGQRAHSDGEVTSACGRNHCEHTRDLWTTRIRLDWPQVAEERLHPLGPGVFFATWCATTHAACDNASPLHLVNIRLTSVLLTPMSALPAITENAARVTTKASAFIDSASLLVDANATSIAPFNAAKSDGSQFPSFWAQ
jgi:hypothetical protein